ncbi:MAG TPA: PAS-domain containing protein [Xanthobacteraceae bacterium]|nr:PAS-domain containing protein [Xanthobacteraceae bacterium]
MNACDAAQADQADQLKQLLALHEAALSSMSHGLSMVDAEQRLVLYNKRFLEMFDLSAEVARIGMPMAELIAHSAARGNFPAAQIELVKRRRADMMARGLPFRLLRQMSRGRTFAMDYRPIAGGGWVTLVEDITERQRKDYAMRVQFERFEQAMNHMSHALCAVDAEHRIVLFNPRFLEMFGLAEDVVGVGVSMRDIIEHSAQRGYYRRATAEQVWQRRLEMMKPGKPFQTPLNLRNGRNYILHYHPMSDGGWVTLCEDVTERTRMERELHLQYERFDQAVNHMSHGLCMFGPDDRLIVCNARYIEMYGLDAGTIHPGITHREVIEHWASGGHDPGIPIEEFVARRKAVVAAKRISTAHLRLRDGRVIEATSRPMANGGWVSAHEDVTERVRYEEALREQNILFDAALKNMAHGLCVFDKDWRVVVRNRRYLELYGLGPEEAPPGTSLLALMRNSIDRGMHTGNASAEKFFADFIRRVTVDREPVVHRRLTNGKLLAVRHVPVENGGWVGTYEDITERERAAEDLKEQHRRFDAALENMAHALCMFDKDWRIIVHNRRFRELYKLPPEAVKPGTPIMDMIRFSLTDGVHSREEASAEEFFADFERRVAAGEQVVVRRFADGRLIAVRYQQMENGGRVCTYEDITQRERAAEELKEQHRRFDIALNNMAHGLCMFDENMRLTVSNKRYAEIFSLPPDVVRPGVSIRDIIAHSIAIGNYRHRNATLEELYDDYVASLNAGELIVHRHLADGRIIKVTHERMPQGGWVAVYEDITERHRAEENIAHMARHDALTQLPNRVLLLEKMADGLGRVESHSETMAVFYLDLDNFKGVNDTLGHSIGDRLLGIIAERVRHAVGEGDTIARLGGDEFAVLQSNSSAEAAGKLARELVEVISEPIKIDGQEINSGVSIGIALAPNDGGAADHLMKCADLALYRAKAEGRGTFRFFEPDMDARIQARRALEVDLRRALTSGEFTLAYQPQINLAANELIAMEALLRWNHPQRGPVPPAEFIPLAEETGLIVPLGEWVLREACKDAAQWPASVRVAVNLSPVQFRNRGLVTTVTQALASARLMPDRLELEITEAVLLQDDDTIVTMLHQLRALGVRIAMDDFGTGYSSLSYLRSFPFDKIKIDRSFIKDIERSRDSAVIIKAIASLGQSLGIDTTAEGIETAEQLELVRRAGCTEMQGYLASPPRPAAEAADLIARFRREVAAA